MAAMTNFPLDYRHLPFGNARAVFDPEVLSAIDDPISIRETLEDLTIHKRFCESYLNWIKSYDLHAIRGLEKFPHACFSNGTSEAFDRFYAKHKSRRFRCFKGEYLYHQLVWRNDFQNWKFIEEDALDSNDAVVISLPFADTGSKHHSHDRVLDQCDQLGIPVLIDCVYLTVSQGLEFDFTHPCITDITFSLSKTFPVAHSRIGMRLSSYNDDDGLFVYNTNAYVNRLSCAIGIKLLEKFPSTYITKKYRNTQVEFCNQLGVEVSDTVLLGIGGSEWQQYNRGLDTNRLSFHNFLHKGTLCTEQK